MTPHIAVFDFGGVLIDWNPRYLYRQLLPDEAAVEEFLATVCTSAWNLEQDAGRPWDQAVEELAAQFPDHAELIAAYRDRWDDMVTGPIPDTAEIVHELRANGTQVYAITNFSVEMLQRARKRFQILTAFDGVIVSGEIGLVKPDPAIYHALLDSYGLQAASTIFIDDVQKNVDGARAIGMHSVLFTSADRLRTDLKRHGFPLV